MKASCFRNSIHFYSFRYLFKYFFLIPKNIANLKVVKLDAVILSQSTSFHAAIYAPRTLITLNVKRSFAALAINFPEGNKGRAHAAE